MKHNIIKLKNLTPLHVGTGREYYDFSAADLHNDTLSAALAALRVSQGKVADIEDFLNSFAISSAYPFYGNNLFLPRFQGKINVSVNGQEEKEYRKKLKKLKFVDSNLWNMLIYGESVAVDEMCLRGSFLLNDKSDFDKPYQSQVNQRVSVARDGDNSDPFFFNWTYFDPNAGLYVLTDVSGTKFNEIVELFKLLGENGIGTDRNVGGGKFEVETGTLELPEIADANATMLLSLYIPTEEELPKLNLYNSRYNILLRGGFMAGSSEEGFRHLRKRSVYMFAVGSVFSTTETLSGKVVDLKPDWNAERMHPVFRSGKPFQLKVKSSDKWQI